MNNKITVLISESDYTSFSSVWMEKVWQEYFDIIPIRSGMDVAYNRKSTIIATSGYRDNWYQKFLDDGAKLIVDNLWEASDPSWHWYKQPNAHVMCNKNWFWYSESLWYTSLGYHNYIPKKTYQNLALVPMHRYNIYRDLLRVALQPYTDRLIMSAGWCGKFLPGDLPDRTGAWQRYLNPDWYNDTYFSIVAETAVDWHEIFVTEKTFKPMAFCHPFMILGQCGLLAYLRSQGFETYENLFDERYDNMPDVGDRIQNIIDNISRFDYVPYDELTQEKIQHNHNRFFDTDLIIKRIKIEIIDPIMEFVHA